MDREILTGWLAVASFPSVRLRRCHWAVCLRIVLRPICLAFLGRRFRRLDAMEGKIKAIRLKSATLDRVEAPTSLSLAIELF
jgi:hypothetical protein